jgi:hypothetical protein
MWSILLHNNYTEVSGRVCKCKGSLCMLTASLCVQFSSVNYIPNGFHYNNVTELFSTLQFLTVDDLNERSKCLRNGIVCFLLRLPSPGLTSMSETYFILQSQWNNVVLSKSSVVGCVDFTAENGETNALRPLVPTDNNAKCRYSKSAIVTGLGGSLHWVFGTVCLTSKWAPWRDEDFFRDLLLVFICFPSAMKISFPTVGIYTYYSGKS